MAKRIGTINTTATQQFHIRRFHQEEVEDEARRAAAQAVFGPDHVQWWHVGFYVRMGHSICLFRTKIVKFPNAWDTKLQPFCSVFLFAPGVDPPLHLYEIDWQSKDRY